MRSRPQQTDGQRAKRPSSLVATVGQDIDRCAMEDSLETDSAIGAEGKGEQTRQSSSNSKAGEEKREKSGWEEGKIVHRCIESSWHP